MIGTAAMTEVRESFLAGVKAGSIRLVQPGTCRAEFGEEVAVMSREWLDNRALPYVTYHLSRLYWRQLGRLFFELWGWSLALELDVAFNRWTANGIPEDVVVGMAEHVYRSLSERARLGGARVRA